MTDISSSILIGVAVAVGVPATFWLFKQCKSLRFEATGADRARLPELAATYAKWDLISGILFLPGAAGCAWVWVQSLMLLASAVRRQIPDSAFLFTPPPTIWWLFAIFLGMVTMGVLMDVIGRRAINKQRYDDFVLYGNLRAGFDTWKVGRLMAKAVVFVAIITVPLTLDTYVRATETHFITNAWLGFGERSHPITTIKEVRKVMSFKAPNGNIRRDPFYEIEFQDGYVWSSRRQLAELSQADRENLVQFVVERTHLPVVTKDPFPS